MPITNATPATAPVVTPAERIAAAHAAVEAVTPPTGLTPDALRLSYARRTAAPAQPAKAPMSTLEVVARKGAVLATIGAGMGLLSWQCLALAGAMGGFPGAAVLGAGLLGNALLGLLGYGVVFKMPLR